MKGEIIFFSETLKQPYFWSGLVSSEYFCWKEKMKEGKEGKSWSKISNWIWGRNIKIHLNITSRVHLEMKNICKILRKFCLTAMTRATHFIKMFKNWIHYIDVTIIPCHLIFLKSIVVIKMHANPHLSALVLWEIIFRKLFASDFTSRILQTSWRTSTASSLQWVCEF